MAKLLIAGCNPVKYVPVDYEDGADNVRLDDKFNLPFLGFDFNSHANYAQKWVVGDPIRQQVWTQGVAIKFIDVVNCEGAVVKTVQPSAASLLNYLVNGEAWDINQFDITDLAAGDYYFVLNYGATTPTIKKWISEKQKVVAELDQSVLIKYCNSFNEYNTIFKTSYNNFFAQTFFLRVEGRVHDKQEEGDYVEFDDQKKNKTLLSAKPFQTWEMIIGENTGGVPDWLGTILNYIRSCDTVMVDEYQISFFDKWEKEGDPRHLQSVRKIKITKSKTEYGRLIDVCEPVFLNTPFANNVFSLPDGLAGRPYYYAVNLGGTKPYTIDENALLTPIWADGFVKIIDDLLIIDCTASSIPTNDNDFIIKVDNPCGTITFTDSMDVVPVASCIPVVFNGGNILPPLSIGVPWTGFIGLVGTAPFEVAGVNKPAWMTVTIGANGITLSGTPNVNGLFNLNLDIYNCGTVLNIINFNQDFNVTSNISMTGYNGNFNSTNLFQSGSIFASPGTLVTVTLTATGGGPIPPETYNLVMTLTGATPNIPLNVTNGTLVGTFTMPASGFVAWVGTYIGSNNLGGGSISLS